MGLRHLVRLIPLVLALALFCPLLTAATSTWYEVQATRASDATRTYNARQSTTMPMSSGDMNANEEGSRAGTGSVSLAVIIPIVVIGVLGLVGGTLWACRYHIFKGRLSLGLRHSQGGQITAQELATGRRDRSASSATGSTRPSGGTGSGAETGTGRSLLTGNGGRAGRAPRNVRRTESGRSIRTLPEYSKEAGDEELVLVRQQSASSTDGESDGDDGPERGGPTSSDLNRFASIRSSLSRQSTRAGRSGREQGETDHGENGQEVIVTGAPGPTGPQSAPLGNSSDSAPRRTLSNASRRGWGEAPTYLEAMSSPSTLEAGVPPPRTPSLRTRTGDSVRGLLSRAGMTFAPASYRPAGRDMQQRYSSTSLLLQPQQSRLSTITSLSRQSRDGRDGSASPYTSPWASTLSLHISSPVPNSAVRASFDDTSFPRAGLSDDQMRFLSSHEAVNMVGVKLGEVPANKRRRTSMGTALGGSPSARGSGSQDGEAPPPTWDEAQAQAGTPNSASHQNPGDATGSNPRTSLSGGDAIAIIPEQAHVPVDTDPSLPEQQPAERDETPAVEIEPPTPIHTSFVAETEERNASDSATQPTGS